jgi:hypothetical protein
VTFLVQKLANTCSFVCERIIVQQEKISRAERTWTNPLNALQEANHYSFIKLCVYCFFLWYEFFVHYALRVEKIINMVLMRDIWNFCFFGRGDVSPTHSELCRFVAGSQAKHQVSSPVIILLKNFCLHRPSQCLGKMWLDLPFAQVSRIVEQNMHTTFSFPNPLSESEELQTWGCSKILPSFLVLFDGLFD